MSAFMDLTPSHCCHDLSECNTVAVHAQLPDRSPDCYPHPTPPNPILTAATHSWSVIIKERGREEQRLTDKGRLINTQRQKQT